jgi:hypothetical protein
MLALQIVLEILMVKLLWIVVAYVQVAILIMRQKVIRIVMVTVLEKHQKIVVAYVQVAILIMKQEVT